MRQYSVSNKSQIYTLYLHFDKSIHKARNEYKRIKNLREAEVPSPTTIRRIIAEMDGQGQLETSSPSAKSSPSPSMPPQTKTKDRHELSNVEKASEKVFVRNVPEVQTKPTELKSKPLSRKSAFGFFVAVCYDTHKANFPSMRIKYEEMSRRCAEQWANMDPKDMKAFQAMADADRLRFEAEIQEYVSIGKLTKSRRLKHCTTIEVTERPKRKLTPFVLFCIHNRSRVKAMMKNSHPRSVTIQLGRIWKKLPSDLKSKYEARADKDKIRYSREMQEYRKKRGENKSAQVAKDRDVDGEDAELGISRTKRLTFTEKPEVPMTPFEAFCLNVKAIISNIFPGAHGQDLAEKLADYWNNLPKTMRNVYEKIAQDDKDRYLKEVEASRKFHFTFVNHPDGNLPDPPPKPKNLPKPSEETGKLLKPKQPLTAFMFFCRDTEFDDCQFKTEGAVQRLQRQWSIIDSHDRARYMILEHTDLIRYSIEMIAYLQAGGNKDDVEELETDSDEIELITIDDSDHEEVEEEQRPRIEGHPINKQYYTFIEVLRQHKDVLTSEKSLKFG